MATLTTTLDLSHVAILSHKDFSTACRRHPAFTQSGEFVLDQLFGGKATPFINSILWSKQSLPAGDHTINFEDVWPRGSSKELDGSLNQKPRVDAPEATRDIALSILFSFKLPGEDENKFRMCHRELALSSKAPLTLHTLAGKIICIEQDQVRVTETECQYT